MSVLSRNTPDFICSAVIQIQRFKKPQQEVGHLSFLALPIRRTDLLFNMCHNKGQDDRLQQEAAVREREPGQWPFVFRGSLSQWRVGSGIKGEDAISAQGHAAYTLNTEAASVQSVNFKCRTLQVNSY